MPDDFIEAILKQESLIDNHPGGFEKFIDTYNRHTLDYSYELNNKINKILEKIE
jgi:hypothetical protein